MLEVALGPERGGLVAYCWCVSTVLVKEGAHVAETSEDWRNPPMAPVICVCDVANSDRAASDYKALGAEFCWKELGVTDAMMTAARAARLAALAEERGEEPTGPVN